MCLGQKSRSKIHQYTTQCQGFRIQDPQDPTQKQNYRIQDPQDPQDLKMSGSRIPQDPTQIQNFRTQDPQDPRRQNKIVLSKTPRISRKIITSGSKIPRSHAKTAQNPRSPRIPCKIQNCRIKDPQGSYKTKCQDPTSYRNP